LIPISDSELRRRRFPVVNVAIIALNALVFLYEIQLGGLDFLFGGGGTGIAVFFHTWGFIPEDLSSGQPFQRLGFGAGSPDITTPAPTWVTIFSSMFIHGGFMHFAGNMLFLWVFGDNIEDRLGHPMYLAFYLLAGLAATMSHWIIDSQSQTPLVGASGAISGVMGAYLLLYPYNRIKVLVLFIFITVVQIPAMYMLGFWFLLQLVNGLGSLGLSSQVDVAFFAHVGGFLAGMGGIALYKLAHGQPVWPSRGRPGPPTQYWRGRPLD